MQRHVRRLQHMVANATHVRCDRRLHGGSAPVALGSHYLLGVANRKQWRYCGARGPRVQSHVLRSRGGAAFQLVGTSSYWQPPPTLTTCATTSSSSQARRGPHRDRRSWRDTPVRPVLDTSIREQPTSTTAAGLMLDDDGTSPSPTVWATASLSARRSSPGRLTISRGRRVRAQLPRVPRTRRWSSSWWARARRPTAVWKWSHGGRLTYAPRHGPHPIPAMGHLPCAHGVPRWQL